MCRLDVAVRGCGTGECVEGKDFDVGGVVGSGVVKDGDEAFVRAGGVVGGVHGGEQAVAERGLFATSCDAMPLCCSLECGPCLRELSDGAQDPPERWIALNHAIRLNKFLGHENRVAMTNREGHSPTPESNEAMYAFLEWFLKPAP